MKKRGFTLAELLVTLGVIGVVAAITAPSLNNLMPKKNKVQALKVYKIINDTTIDLLNDSGFYWTADCSDGLDCTAQPLKEPNNGISKAQATGGAKYGMLLCSTLYTSGCTSATNVTFTTNDGMTWEVTPARKITVDINGSESPNCIYPSCNKPDRFSFSVDKNGVVTGADAKTKEFIADPYKLSGK